jgi:hypothetical protein
MENLKIHPFEVAGLGIAPFRFVGVDSQGEMIGCAYCGTGIKHKFLIVSSDGKKSKVGCDCIQKIDYGLYLIAKKAHREAIRQARLESVREGRKSQKAKNVTEFSLLFPEIWAYLVKIWEIETNWQNFSEEERNQYLGWNQIPFCVSLKNQVERFGKLSDKQILAIQKIIHPELVKAGEWIGEVGKKFECELTLKFKKVFPGRFGDFWIISLSDENENEFVYKGGTIEFLFHGENGNECSKEGEKLRLGFKIKDHANYQGKKQNVIGYVKRADVKRKI